MLLAVDKHPSDDIPVEMMNPPSLKAESEDEQAQFVNAYRDPGDLCRPQDGSASPS